jgi:hypothetical protein
MEARDTLTEVDLCNTVSANGAVPVDWEIDQAAMEHTLLEMGMDDQRLLLQSGDELSLVTQLIVHLCLQIKPVQVELHRRRFLQKISDIEKRAPMARRIRGDLMPVSAQRIRDAGQSSSTTTAPSITPLPPAWIPPPGQRLTQGAGTRTAVGTREQQENAQQAFWSAKVTAALEKAEAPLWDMAKESMDPAAVLRGAIGSTRGSTMESYCKAMGPLWQWGDSTGKGIWPSSVFQLVDFLHLCGCKPCSPSYARRLEQAISWFEKVGCWPEPERLSTQERVHRTVAFWSEALRSGLRPLRQAVRYPWCTMAALELFVMDPSRSKHLRLKAWTMLLKGWGTLREDDIQHLSPGTIRVSEELVVSELTRSKTSGASKRVRELPIAVWIGATLTKQFWLEAGLLLLAELTDKANDFILPWFDAVGVPVQKPLSYIDSSCLSHQVISELKLPVFDEASTEWKPGPCRLSSESMVPLWTEHSGRPVIPPAAQVLQFGKDECNYLGRWSPGGSADYARAYRVIAHSIQNRVWKAVLNADPRLYEWEVLDRIPSWGEARHWLVEQVSSEKGRLDSTFKEFWVEVGKAGGPLGGVDAPVQVSLPVKLIMKPLAKVVSAEGRDSYLLVFSRGRKASKLHRVGGCQWTLVKLADAQEILDPLPAMYSSRCKLCWPILLGKDGAVDGNDSSSDSGL